MAITTTESIGHSAGPRCSACGKLARGGLLAGDVGHQLGVCCCARGLERDLLLAMVADAPEPVEPPQIPFAHDPLGRVKGPVPALIEFFGLKYPVPGSPPRPEADPALPALPKEQTGRPLGAKPPR